MTDPSRPAVPAPGSAEAPPQRGQVRIDQDLCTGDGLCVTYAPEVFEFDIDGLAYVKSEDGELRTAPGEAVTVPATRWLEVLDAAEGCPGHCIHVVDDDGRPVGGPLAEEAATGADVSR